MLFSTHWKGLLRFETITKYTRSWETDEQGAKIMNILTYLHSKRKGNVKNKSNSPVNIRFVAKTSDIMNVSENIRSDVKSSEAATLGKMPTIVTSSEPLKICCHDIFTQQRPTTEESTPKFSHAKEHTRVICKITTAWHQNHEPVSCALWM